MFVSTPVLPTTVTLADPLSDVTLWKMDVPVGHKLVLDLDRPPELERFKTTARSATKMSWSLYDMEKRWPVQSDKMDLAGTPVVISVSYRPSPEYSPETVPLSEQVHDKTEPTTASAEESASKIPVPDLE